MISNDKAQKTFSSYVLKFDHTSVAMSLYILNSPLPL